MTRRLLMLVFVLVLSSVAMAMPASASGGGATTFTQTMHGPLQPFNVDATCGAPSGTITGTGNSIFHVTVSKDGNEFWVTSTTEEWFTITPDDKSLPTFSGHFAAWFGVSVNQNNSVQHDILNVQATANDGSGTTVRLNLVDHISVSASGQVNAFTACH